MKRKNKRISLVLSLITIAVVMGMQLAFAVEGVSMPKFDRDTSSLTVEIKCNDNVDGEQISTPVKGMKLTAYKAADVTVKSGLVNYTSTDAFKSVSIDYNNLTASGSNDAAKQLFKYATENAISGKALTTDADGRAAFGDLENGMYLVAQTGAEGAAKEYTNIDPYLVMLPQNMTEVGEDGWNYDVVSSPKMRITPKTITINKKVNSEDNISVEKRDDVFAYVIEASLNYVPESFAIVDNVPEQLEIVDPDRIEIKVGDEALSKDVVQKLVKIEGNTLRVEPDQEQLEKWASLGMSIKFYSKFRDNIQLSINGDNSVVNKAGYEVDGEYYQPPGNESEATVKGVFEPKQEENEGEVKSAVVEKKDKKTTKVKAANTGDYIKLYAPVILIVLAAAVLIFMLVRRRRKDAE